MDLNRDLPGQLRRYVRDGRDLGYARQARGQVCSCSTRSRRRFEPGRRYQELVVNEILKAFYDDHAALRRYLIDEGLLSRTPDGTYWRSGGLRCPLVLTPDLSALLPGASSRQAANVAHAVTR